MKTLVLCIGAFALGAAIMFYHDTVLATICANVDFVQNQFPAECTEARVSSLFQ